MKKIGFIILFLFIFASLANAITGEEIIKRIDQNMLFKTAKMTARMIIKTGIEVDEKTGKPEADTVREKKLLMYSEGSDKAYAEFLYPNRDKGVKYLKIGDNLWMYLPSVEKVIKIAGHMLRQSMMGSDFSYEDSMESDSLVKKYDAKLVGSEKYLDRECYVVELVAKVKEVTYYKVKLWVDKERFVYLKEELYAKSGKLLKVMVVTKVDHLGGGRYYPTYMTMRNMLRKDSKTDFIIDSIELDVKLPAGIFSLRNLRKG
ncbi:MAG: outer membrane lipoprotein-sorting protein [Candidatus Margulisbacteria bacterium]|nr:outer membrane lipoprotein-sorting protein [Candidatus Margulisiibacteriota bacterium]MBU1021273.1 outer membrane lipoprotein-sorting protein [Candidatus Margulisiibacteriota bacterium]MBU1729238.1 outer membrane lipoprotein-sorting protein [Candidatus Margulisiibacteriota bacterium]MBU1954911.1 outer membrane lipoprotein-sorting protein [Candidatus Margulisiibacteriota bacterium]